MKKWTQGFLASLALGTEGMLPSKNPPATTPAGVCCHRVSCRVSCCVSLRREPTAGHVTGGGMPRRRSSSRRGGPPAPSIPGSASLQTVQKSPSLSRQGIQGWPLLGLDQRLHVHLQELGPVLCEIQRSAQAGAGSPPPRRVGLLSIAAQRTLSSAPITGGFIMIFFFPRCLGMLFLGKELSALMQL